MTNDSVQVLTDEQLLTHVTTVAGRERKATARLIVLLSELDARRLYLGEGYSSLFTFCTRRLRLSEHAAYNRIEAARASRKSPRIAELLADGAVTLTTIRLLSSHLTADNHQRVLAAAHTRASARSRSRSRHCSRFRRCRRLFASFPKGRPSSRSLPRQARSFSRTLRAPHRPARRRNRLGHVPFERRRQWSRRLRRSGTRCNSRSAAKRTSSCAELRTSYDTSFPLEIPQQSSIAR